MELRLRDGVSAQAHSPLQDSEFIIKTVTLLQIGNGAASWP